MAFSFSSRYNPKKIFDIDTSDFDYCSLEELFEENKSTIPVTDDAGVEIGDLEEVCTQKFKVYGLYINDKSIYEPQPIAALDDRYVNLPAHLYKVVVDILSDPRAIEAINKGHVGFEIEKYYQKRYKKDCFTIKWIDM